MIKLTLIGLVFLIVATTAGATTMSYRVERTDEGNVEVLAIVAPVCDVIDVQEIHLKANVLVEEPVRTSHVAVTVARALGKALMKAVATVIHIVV